MGKIADTNTRMLITLPKELKKELEQKAKEDNRSISNYVVTLIQKDLINSSPT
jgi:hypothetical protein